MDRKGDQRVGRFKNEVYWMESIRAQNPRTNSSIVMVGHDRHFIKGENDNGTPHHELARKSKRENWTREADGATRFSTISGRTSCGQPQRCLRPRCYPRAEAQPGKCTIDTKVHISLMEASGEKLVHDM